MTLLENEVVVLKGKNKCNKKDFIALTLLSCLHIFALASICYLIFYKVVNFIIVLIVAIIVYFILFLVQLNKTYQNYQKFFGNDEIVITKEKLYYNVCMNKKGQYINYDSFIYLKDLKEVFIKKGFYPKRLTIVYENKDKDNINVNIDGNAYMNIHCLDNAEEIYDYLSCLINKN